jgi:hypothetical protein
MEKTLYLPVWLAAADRKSEIFRLIRRGPARGLLALTLHEAGTPGRNFKPAGVLWKYEAGTEPEQISTVIDDVNQHIATAFQRRDRVYRGATITTFALHPPTRPAALMDDPVRQAK